jgi:hypothetical protein
MTAIQFTRNHSDHSTDKGYQFEFFCDRCGNGFKSEFKASMTGYATGAIRAAGSIFGGVFGRAGAGAYEIERAIQGPGHDRHSGASGDQPQFASAEVHALGVPDHLLEPAPWPLRARRARNRGRRRSPPRRSGEDRDGDLTRELDSAGAAAPRRAARPRAKFCLSAGPGRRTTWCGTKFEAKSRFCPECGQKLE